MTERVALGGDVRLDVTSSTARAIDRGDTLFHPEVAVAEPGRRYVYELEHNTFRTAEEAEAFGVGVLDVIRRCSTGRAPLVIIPFMYEGRVGIIVPSQSEMPRWGLLWDGMARLTNLTEVYGEWEPPHREHLIAQVVNWIRGGFQR